MNDIIVTTFREVFGTVSIALIGRVLLAIVLCGMIGLERSKRDRAAGFRTHILVGLGACMLTIVGGYGFSDVTSGNRDPMRLASYVISSIGFLGAGAILRHGTIVRGLTTAASLWSAAGLGIAVGAGLGGLAVVASTLILFTLLPLKRLESQLASRRGIHDLVISLQITDCSVGEVLTAMRRLGAQVRHATIETGETDRGTLRIRLAQPLKADQAAFMAKRLYALKSVENVEVLTHPSKSRQKSNTSSAQPERAADPRYGVQQDR